MRTLVRPAAATAALATALVLAPTSARAATNPYTPKEVCGSSYDELEHHAISDMTGHGGGRLGTVYLMWSESLGRNCVVTIKTSAVGVATWTEAALQVEGDQYRQDHGNFKYYASLDHEARRKCIRWAGSIAGTGGAYGTWSSGPDWVRCR